MAGDPFLTWILMGLGLRELSMDRDRIPLVKAVELVRGRLDARFAGELEGFIPRALR